MGDDQQRDRAVAGKEEGKGRSAGDWKRRNIKQEGTGGKLQQKIRQKNFSADKKFRKLSQKPVDTGWLV